MVRRVICNLVVSGIVALTLLVGTVTLPAAPTTSTPSSLPKHLQLASSSAPSWSLFSATSTSGTSVVQLNGTSCKYSSACWGVGSTSAGDAAVEQWNGATWSQVSSPTVSGTLQGVTCVTSMYCFAVGYSYGSLGYDLPLIEQWNGTSWSGVSVPATGSTDNDFLQRVSCTSTAFCVAAGWYGTDTSNVSQTFVEQWNGSSWNIVSSPNTSTTLINSLSGVSCTSTIFCVAVGYALTSGGGGQGLVEQWNGSSWSIVSSPTTPVGIQLNGVSCVSSTWCTAVGDSNDGLTLVEQWNGSSWSVVSSPNENPAAENVLYDVSCLSTAFCAAAGVYDTSSGYSQTLTEEWNGTSWTFDISANAGTSLENTLYGVTCQSTTVCWAVGYVQDSSGNDHPLSVGTLPAQATPADTADAQQAATTGNIKNVSQTQCTCKVGKPVNTQSGDLYDTATDINVPGRGFNLNVTRSYNSMLRTDNIKNAQLLNVSCTTASNCWAVGYYVNAASQTYAIIQNFNGSTWTIGSDSIPGRLSGVSCDAVSDCWAVGYEYPYANLLAVHYDGSTWSQVTMPNTPGNSGGTFSAVACTSSSDCWAVGNSNGYTNGLLAAQWNGTSWTYFNPPGSANYYSDYLYSVSCPSSSLCWAGGWQEPGSTQESLFEEWNGTSWSQVSVVSTSSHVNSVACASTTECIATGDNGTSVMLEQWNGTSWSAGTAPSLPSGDTGEGEGVSCASTTACWAVGYYSGSSITGVATLAFEFNGSAWSLAATPNEAQGRRNEFYSISCPTSTSCVGAGDLNMGAATEFMNETWDGTQWNLEGTFSPAPESTGNGPFGYGWTSNLSMNLTSPYGSGLEVVTDGSGTSIAFAATNVNGSTVYEAPGFSPTTLTYDSTTSTWTYTKWDGSTYVFNSSGQLTSESDRNGNTTTFTYSSGQLATMTDASGRTLTFTWTGSNITKITDPNSQSVTYTYDGSGNLASVTNLDGKTTTYTYDSNHDLLTATDPNTNVTETNTFDAEGRVLTQKDALGNEMTFTYGNPSPGVTTTLVTDPNSNETLYTFEDGLLVQKVEGYGTASAAQWNYAYDPTTLGMTSMIDPNGNMTTYTYDGSGNLLTKTDPLGHEWQYTYNSLNEVLTATDPLGVTTTNTYDSAGNLLTTSTPLLNSSGQTIATATTTYTYGDSSNPGLPTAVQDPNGHTTNYTYDSYGDLASVTDPLTNKTTYTYDVLGRKLTMVSPNGNVTGGTPANYTTTWTYNPYNEVLTVTDPNGHTTTNTYDADGNLLTSTQPSGTETISTYNADNEVTQVQTKDSGGTVVRTTSTGYDKDGNVTSQTDGNGNTTTYTYNALNQQTSSTNALGKATDYTYDGVGNLLTETTPNGVTVTNTYDAANELTKTTYSDSTPTVTYSYDADGRKTGMTDGTGTSSWTYDSLGRLTSYANGAGAEVQYGYDIAGNQTSITYPGSHTVTQGFNSGNEMTSIADWNSNQATFTYDANGNLTGESLPNGVTDTYTYDPANNLTGISDVKGSTTVFAATYSLNPNNLIMADSSQPSSTQNYQYSALNQVCYAGSSNTSACSSPPSGATAYAYDPAGNLTTNNGTTQSYNAGDELCWTVSGTSSNGCSTAPTGATTYSYDASGNRTATTPASGSASSYTYNGTNELTQYQLGSGTATTYAYDGDGLRQSKTTGTTTTQYLWDESASVPLLLQETTGSNTTDYVYGPTGLPLEEILPSGSTYYYAHDSLGSTRALTDSSGAVANTDTYDPYGNITASTGSVANPFLYAGQYLDSESGLYYLRARYYDPATAQFVTVDPMVAQTQSPYGYTAGDPVNAIDPSGQTPFLPTPYHTPTPSPSTSPLEPYFAPPSPSACPSSVSLPGNAKCEVISSTTANRSWWPWDDQNFSVSMHAMVWYNGSSSGLLNITIDTSFSSPMKVDFASGGAYCTQNGNLGVWGNVQANDNSALALWYMEFIYAYPRILVRPNGTYHTFGGWAYTYGENPKVVQNWSN